MKFEFLLEYITIVDYKKANPVVAEQTLICVLQWVDR